ncbi:hypothetical protein EDB80DRAFT_814408 [Ilyonectria destructans]|nr:hypothetical protein EDB80DRAFT_814408 [Ilyonectria destructans]
MHIRSSQSADHDFFIQAPDSNNKNHLSNFNMSSSSRLPGPTNSPTSSSKGDWNSEDSTTDGSKSTEAGPSTTNVGPKEKPFNYKSPIPSPDSWGYVTASLDEDDATSPSKSKGKQPAKPLKRILKENNAKPVEEGEPTEKDEPTKTANNSAKPSKSGKRARFDPIASPLDDLQQFKDKGVGIFMVISRPAKGRFYQWSIALYNRVKEEWWTTEAFQPPSQGAYAPVWNTHKNDPRSLPGYIVMHFLAHVRESSLENLMGIALRIQECAAHDTGLDSQGYVMHAWLARHP